jgi:D-sedoheptulose 7-phosphate isomerase
MEGGTVKTRADSPAAQLRESAKVKLALARTHGTAFAKASRLLVKCLKTGHTILLCGNGGSAADAQHIATEIVGRFVRQRKGLAAIALTTDTSALTSISNDFGFEFSFARQVEALGRKGDVLVAFSTSGRSPNVLEAIRTARACGAAVIGMTGEGGGAMADMCDVLFAVPSKSTQRIQEAHITVGHILCEDIDAAFGS